MCSYSTDKVRFLLSKLIPLNIVAENRFYVDHLNKITKKVFSVEMGIMSIRRIHNSSKFTGKTIDIQEYQIHVKFGSSRIRSL